MINAQCDRRSSSTVEWALPSKALTVQVAKDVLSRIQTEVAQSMAIDPHSCPGGLLVGNSCRSSSWRISIDKHVPLEWDDSRGGAPFLMDSQLARITEKISSLALHTTVVGFYRASRAVEYRNHDETDHNVTDAEKKLLASCLPLSGVGLGVRLKLPNLDPDVFALWENAEPDECMPKNGQVAHAPASPIPSEPDTGATAYETPANQQWQIAVSEKQARGSLLGNVMGAQPAYRQVYMRATAWVLATVLLSLLTYIAAHLYVKPMLLDLAREQVGEKPAKGASATLPVRNSLGLSVSENGTALELQWDRLSPTIQGANVGKLSIMDGTLLRQIDLDQDQLRSGRIIYIPVLGDVSFRLEIRNPTSPPVFESIHVLNGVLSSMSDQPLLPDSSLHRPEGHSRFTSPWRSPVERNIGSAGTPQPPPTHIAVESADRKRLSVDTKRIASSAGRGNVLVVQAPLRGAKSANSVGESLVPALPDQPTLNAVQLPREEGPPQIIDNHAKSAQASPADLLLTQKPLPDATTMLASSSVSQTDRTQQGITPGDYLPQTTASLRVYPAISAPNLKSTEKTRKQDSSSLPSPALKPGSEVRSKQLSGAASSYVPPRALKQVQPNLRFLWPLVYKPSEIEVDLKIDASGHVTAVDVPKNATKPNQMLVTAAIAAAKAWVFEPARLHGIRVAASDTIVFRFEPRK